MEVEGVYWLDQLRRAVVALAQDPARSYELSPDEPYLTRGLRDNFVIALDETWPELADTAPFTAIENALFAVEQAARDEDWSDPGFVEASVWIPARLAARRVAAERGWSLDADPYDDVPPELRGFATDRPDQSRRRGTPRRRRRR